MADKNAKRADDSEPELILSRAEAGILEAMGMLPKNYGAAKNVDADADTDADSPALAKDAAIYIAGHRGMVGSAIVRRLQSLGYANLITRERKQLDLCDAAGARKFFRANTVDYVVLAAAKVGGIRANNAYPAEFIHQNLMLAANVIHEAWQAGVTRLLFLGSSCIYPRAAAQPIAESELLRGALEPTCEPYAVAKIAGIKLCESYNRQYGASFRSVMPTNLYGPGDNFHLDDGHVIPALIHRFLTAKESGKPQVRVWGSGDAKRDFLHVDDLADACIHVMQLSDDAYAACTSPQQSHLNIGSGAEVTVAACAELIRDATGYTGDIVFDSDQPDGAPRKLLDTSIFDNLGWRARIKLADGIAETCRWFQEHRADARA
ncbi:MAG: GDP-L-fucose synthase [Gammaproteobacteria bacterium]|nr:GDP-L-fucose synthase [Gammaproteobacteria bacterium]